MTQVIYERSKGLQDVETHYCPGCHHGVIHKLIAEVMVEMGDICIRRYLIPLSKFLSIDLIPNSPTVSVDKLEDRLKFPDVLKHLHESKVIRIETNYVDSDQRFQGAIIYVPDPKTQNLTFKRFGVDAESQMATFSKFGL